LNLIFEGKKKQLTHLAPRYLSAFNDDFGFGAKESRVPENQVRHFAHLEKKNGLDSKCFK